MAATVDVFRERIYDRIGDVDKSAQVVPPFKLYGIIRAQAILMASRTIRPRSTVQSITLVNGTYDYALASNGLVKHVGQVLLDGTGAELCYVPFELFNERYRQATSEPASSGTPAEYTVWETTAQVATLRVGPTPNTSGVADGPLKVYHEILPALLSDSDLTDVFFGSTSIPFSTDLVVGLEAACAAEALSSERAREALGVSADQVNRWRAEAELAIRNYNQRQLGLGRRQSEVIRHRYGWFGRTR